MKPVGKIQLLSNLTSITESHLGYAVQILQNLPEQKLLTGSPAGGWSAAQCLEHLNRYGLYYLPAIKAAILQAHGTTNDHFRGSWLGNYFTRMMDPASGTKKIKAFKEYSPAPTLNAHEVTAAFIEQLELLLLYLKECQRIDIGAVKIPISLTKLIRLKLGDVLQFVIAHNRRHIKQLQVALQE